MTVHEFLAFWRSFYEIEDEKQVKQVKDDQKNSILTGYYTAIFSRVKRLDFPKNMLDEIYAEKEAQKPTKQELKEGVAILENIKKGGFLDARKHY